jgi:hypothetical protein
VTYAASPAASFGDQGEEVACIGTSSVPELVATATQHGLVAIWNISRQLKVCYRCSYKLHNKNVSKSLVNVIIIIRNVFS